MINPPNDISSLLQNAMQLFSSGRLNESDDVCKHILQISPDNSYAMQLSGVIAHDSGKLERAATLLSKSAALRPGAPDIFNSLGLVYADQNRPEEAINCYQAALKIMPDYVPVYNNLGVVYKTTGNLTRAIESFLHALKLDPGNPEFYCNLAGAYMEASDVETAERYYKTASQSSPGYPDALYNLAVICGKQDKPEEAENYYRDTLKNLPSHYGALTNLALLLKVRGKLSEAIQLLLRATLDHPEESDANYNLGTCYQAANDMKNAAIQYRKALSQDPDDCKSMGNLGVVMQKAGNLSEAKELFTKVIALNDSYAYAHSNLATVLHKQGDFKRAMKHYVRAAELEPGNGAIYYNIGNALVEQGKIDEALDYYLKSIDLCPEDPEVFSNYLFAQNCSTSLEPEAIYKNHLDFARRFESPLAGEAKGLSVNKEISRPLKIGYVSADLKDHPVAYFLEPLLKNHDRSKFQIIAYCNNSDEDLFTRRLRLLTDYWINISSMTDEEVANNIRSDAIDILVDLGGHTGNNRLLVFARKPAPIQITWLGYLNTTGLSAMDYRLTDAAANPSGQADLLHTETLVRIAGCQWCFMPPDDALDIGQLPAIDNGYITFASFHNLAKITKPVISLWSRVLLGIPGSKLIFVGKGIDTSPDLILERFRAFGVSADRLELMGRLPFINYLKLHNRVDICLDTFPYSGGTTTCQSLWMGVPVITLAGKHIFSRGGASLLNMVELNELIASTEDEYVNIAVRLASNHDWLSEKRMNLRSVMRGSPLTDGPMFCRKLENIYRDMWERYCVKPVD